MDCATLIPIFFEFGLLSCKIEQIPAAPTETNHPIYVCQLVLKCLTINFIVVSLVVQLIVCFTIFRGHHFM